MKWQCGKCGLKLNVNTRRVFCQCGNIEDVKQRGAKDYRAVNHQLPAFNRDAPIVSPSWEREERRSICGQCDHFNRESARCPFIDLGCHRTYVRVVETTQGRCPEGKWGVSSRKWVSNADMAALVVKVAQRLPADVTRIAGVPRSGMMAAAYLAAHLHLPLYTVLDGQITPAGGGSRMLGHVERPGRTVIVDDTVAGGLSFIRLRESGVATSDTLLVAMHCSPESRHIPDIIGEILPLPHLLEWNLFSCGYMDMAGLDIDGIICEDNWDNPDPKPLYLPRNRPAKSLITARPEAMRDVTRAWLEKWGVQYQSLVMWPGNADNRTLEAVADYKAAAVVATEAAFYVESSVGLANAMRERGIRVLCPEEGWLR
jgi:hypothetical protein